LLTLIKLHREDPRARKLDLGVGVYRDAAGATPVLAAVKDAETLLLREQDTKAYLGPEGDVGFLELIASVVFGESAGAADLVSVQTPGGTGALRLAAELVAAANPRARIWMGAPSWPIHAGIFRQARLEVQELPYFDQATQTATFGRFLEGLKAVARGDVTLLHAACHNPTGADLSLAQWALVLDLLQRRGAIPLIDLAYQGLGDGLDEDVAGLRMLAEHCETVLVAQSCDKNFGLYRERTGALFVRVPQRVRALIRSNLHQLARCAWSMPPDHGAAVVRVILESGDLASQWRAELAQMRDRLRSLRGGLADAAPRLAALRDQRGLFALLPLSGGAVERLRREHGIYMAAAGRINVAGLDAATIPGFAAALDAVL
jgi:aromatic-amino-acid transaminase